MNGQSICPQNVALAMSVEFSHTNKYVVKMSLSHMYPCASFYKILCSHSDEHKEGSCLQLQNFSDVSEVLMTTDVQIFTDYHCFILILVRMIGTKPETF